MKILIDARLYGLENAGLGRYSINLVSELAKIDDKNKYVILLRKKYFDNLVLPNNWRKVLVNYRHYGFAEQIKIPGIIKKENPNIVHFPHFNVPIFYRGKFVVTIHDMLMHKSIGPAATTLPAPLYFLKRLGYRLVFDNAIRYSTKIIVPSMAVKNDLIRYYKIPENKIYITYEGVDIKNTATGNKKDDSKYFVYTGNAYPHKNLERLIRAIILLNKEVTHPIKLMIASSRGIFTQRLENIINKLNAGKYVKLLGFVPDGELFKLYKDSTGFIFPSISEGFGLPGLEAMGSGTILLASDIAVFKEIYQDNAVYFDPLDAFSIKKTMKNVLEMDSNLRREKIEKASNFVKQYSWAKMAKETLKIYEESCDSLRSGK